MAQGEYYPKHWSDAIPYTGLYHPYTTITICSYCGSWLPIGWDCTCLRSQRKRLAELDEMARRINDYDGLYIEDDL